MKLTKSITVKTFALMAAAVLTVSSPLAAFAADQTSMNDQATEAAQKFYRAALEAGNDEETAMKIAQDAVIKTKKAIVQKKAEDISDGTVSDELTDEERQILDEVMKEDTAQSASAASTESSETSAASTQSGADLQAQAENQNDAALYLSQAAAQAKDIQDAAAMASAPAASTGSTATAAASTNAAATASTDASVTASTNAATAASTDAAAAASTDAAAATSTESTATAAASTEAATAASTDAAATAGTEAAAAATTETAAAQTQTQQQTPAASYQAAQALQALQQVQLQQAQAAAQAAQVQAAAQTNTAVSASDRELLAAIIYCEAGNQSHTGKVAVGNVVMNRVNSAKFPNSISSVVYQRGQFSPAGSGWLNRVLKRGTVPADCYAAADEALAGSKPVGGSVFFMRRELHSSGTIIGAHCFWGMM
ncbi:MAG: cell wall hydrolase [Lachnospiraceae bacterium]|nr:cell wall hydrolase [Lachnospiraceae bacterium]